MYLKKLNIGLVLFVVILVGYLGGTCLGEITVDGRPTRTRRTVRPRPVARTATTTVSTDGVVVLNFDDLPPVDPYGLLPSGYGGLEWDCNDEGDPVFWGWKSESLDPDYSEPHSGDNYLFNAYGVPHVGFSLPNPDDCLIGAWFAQTTAWDTPDTVRFNGYNDSHILVQQSDWLVLSPTPQYLEANFDPVARIEVEHSFPSEAWYSMDDLTYQTEPICVPPVAPANPDPCDGAVDVNVNTNLQWGEGCSAFCQIPNGGFESGDFAPWTTVTAPGEQYYPWEISSGGTGWFENGFPFEGSFFATNGFDGEAELFYDIYQEIEIPICATTAILEWSERIQWDLLTFEDPTLPRIYEVTLQPAGGGPPLAVLFSMLLEPETIGDTGYVQHNIDLLSVAPGIAGQTVRINFHEYIPEYFTGPAQFDLDGISLTCSSDVSALINRSSLSSQQAGPTNSAALQAKYNRMRGVAPTSNNAPAGVRNGVESPSVKEEAPPEIISTNIGVLNKGGPDCGGYYFIDSDEPGGPSFDWIEISGTGTNLNLGDDTWYYPINLPFNFDFYGTGYNQLSVGSNGHIYFVDLYLGLTNSCIPGITGYGVDRFIAVYWDDIVCSDSDNAYYQIVGRAPNRKLVVQWNNVRHYGTEDRLTFQAQLSEGSGDILMLYVDPSSEAGAGATVGIQSDPSCGLQYLCNEAGLHSDLAILFSRVDPCPTKWDVYFGTDPAAMDLICEDLNEMNCDPTPNRGETLDAGTTYYWQVVAKNCCAQTEGEIWSFTTEGMPPDCSGAFPSIDRIWPPNHKWVDIEILGVVYPNGDPAPITITGITQDEPVAVRGSGNTVPDGDGIGTSVARVRAERSGLGNGRVYEISFEAGDSQSGTCSGSVQVCVPHSSRPSEDCIDDGQLFDSTAADLFDVDLNSDGVINRGDLALILRYWLVSYELDL